MTDGEMGKKKNGPKKAYTTFKLFSFLISRRHKLLLAYSFGGHPQGGSGVRKTTATTAPTLPFMKKANLGHWRHCPTMHGTAT